MKKTEIVEKLSKLITDSWLKLKSSEERAIWWDEQNLTFAFYAYLKPKIDHLNKSLKETRLYLVPEYATKASSYAYKPRNGKKYPLVSC